MLNTIFEHLPLLWAPRPLRVYVRGEHMINKYFFENKLDGNCSKYTFHCARQINLALCTIHYRCMYIYVLYLLFR